MKIAIYHNLPSGGAKRALYEFVTRLKNIHDFDLYRLDLPDNESFLDIRPHVKQVFNYAFKEFSIQQLTNNPTYPEVKATLRSLAKVQAQIANDIDSKGYDLVFITHCRFTQSPILLRYLETSNIYYIHEPRRASYEYNIAPRIDDGKSPVKIVKRINTNLIEQAVRQQDEKSAKAADYILCNSYYCAESIARAYGEKAKVAYLGVDDKLFRVLKNIKKTNSAISVGALHPNKGHDFIIEALGMLNKKDRPRLFVVYDRYEPRYREIIQSLADKNEVELEFFHRIGDEKLVELYNRARVCICAAELEPFGLTPLEAMCCGTPVVATNQAGYRETVISGKNGYLVDREIKSLANGVEKFFKSSSDLSHGQDLHCATADRWSWEKAIQNLNKLMISYVKTSCKEKAHKINDKSS